MYCPICKKEHAVLIHQFNGSIDNPILENLKEELPGWTPKMGACSRCVDQAQLDTWAEQEATPIYTTFDGYKILPIPTRLGIQSPYSGKGVTICFIDSGFYPHPDINDRIFSIQDLSGSKALFTPLIPETHSWHGTMTAVVGAGNGCLSKGVYKSLASTAQLVLLKVADEHGKISSSNLVKAIQWAIDHQQEFNIRVINLSVSDDLDTSYRINEVDQAVQKATEAGIVVVAAAGNDNNAAVKAPANSPHAITVGGLDDHNTLYPAAHTLYHSTYGKTVDGFQKPDLIAPAIWVPAPILPLTKAQEDASLLFDIVKTERPQYFKAKYTNTAFQLGLNSNLVYGSIEAIQEAVQTEMGNRKLISPHYQHADGTSFAAPIVCGIVAQMLEANPALNPDKVKEILTQTARKLPDTPAERQGFGVIHPPSAIQAAEKNTVHKPRIVFF